MGQSHEFALQCSWPAGTTSVLLKILYESGASSTGTYEAHARCTVKPKDNEPDYEPEPPSPPPSEPTESPTDPPEPTPEPTPESTTTEAATEAVIEVKPSKPGPVDNRFAILETNFTNMITVT
eukprot:GHVU01031246.1.p1 GENE.GHVU01031246.1~~GHVU01031246.1.p1  ORF type:complete len:123 (-),score=16.90 GHVU01031246.1:20-388(-)